jgi:hypothetical protein
MSSTRSRNPHRPRRNRLREHILGVISLAAHLRVAATIG